MTKRSQWAAASMAVTLLLVPAMVRAQATPTPTATPTPLASINTLPNGQPVSCLTGAETPPSFLGVSGGNINSVSIQKTGAVSCSAGTLGSLVQDSNGTEYVLGSNYVLARASGKKSAKAHEPIVQPSLPDLGCWQDTTDTVAQLSKWVPINFSKGENQMDAAIAKVVPAVPQPNASPVPGVWPDGRILNLGVNGSGPYYGYVSTTPFPYDDLTDGMFVMKMGRTSCLTAGKIDAFDAMGLVIYPAGSNQASTGVARFNHQILVIGADPTTGTPASFASTGDSGSLVVTLTDGFYCPQAVGMVFAGVSGGSADSGGEIVAVSPIQTILNKFGVSLVGDSSCTPAAPSILTASADIPANISDTLRASIERVRNVKRIHGPTLLKMRGVVAVGISTGGSDHAALNVYLKRDTPQIRRSVLAEIGGRARIIFRPIAGRFRPL